MRSKKRINCDSKIKHTDSIRDQLERVCSVTNDSVHLKRQVGLLSGVALIVGTMIGN
ncbi:hypothetical protein PGB90_003538 [Kerria lacca]